MSGNFRRGGDAASEAAKAAQGGNFARVNYLQIEDGKQEVIRYITDWNDLIYVDQHASVPTKQKPSGHDGNWPESMPAVCRKDEAFNYGDDCYICNAEIVNQWGRVCKPTVRQWGLAVLRDEVIGTKEMAEDGDIEEKKIGKRIGFTDRVREVDVTDEKGEKTGTKMEIAIVVVNMAPGNYFDGLGACYSSFDPDDYERSICDRDMIVKRTGTKKDTDYFHIPLEPTPKLRPGLDRWKKYEDAVKEQSLDLGQIISDKASDDYYARFFDPNKTPTPRGGDKDKGGSAPEPQDKGDDGVDQDKLASMRDRIRAKSGKTADVD